MAEKPLTNSINALTAYINGITGEADTNLSDAIVTLVEGYGGVSLDDIISGNEPSGQININAANVKTYVEYRNSNITGITGDGVVTVNDFAFGSCTNLVRVEMPNVTSIKNSAFSSCSKLQTVRLPKCESLNPSVFSGCDLLSDSIYFPSLKSIGDSAFKNNYHLTTIKLPSAQSINSRAFTGCSGLTDIYLPNAASTYTGAPFGAPATCTVHYNTQFDEDGEPIIE